MPGSTTWASGSGAGCSGIITPGNSEASGIASPISKRAARPSCSKMSCSSTVSTSSPGGVGASGVSGAGGSGFCSSGAGAVFFSSAIRLTSLLFQMRTGPKPYFGPAPVTSSSFPCHAKTPPFLQPGGVFGKVDSPFCCCLSCFPLSSVATVKRYFRYLCKP